MSKHTYLDYAATTPLDARIGKELMRVAKKYSGNASSVHRFGREAAHILDRSRQTVADFFGAQFNEIIFTSGATESNNLAITGLVSAFEKKRPSVIPHIVTSVIEHSSVKEVIDQLESAGRVRVTRVEVDQSGIVSVDAIAQAFTEHTILVSVMYVNNEIGTIQPIRDIGKLIKKTNEQKESEILKKKSAGEKVSFGSFDIIYFHTDAVQAIQYCDSEVLRLHVDMLTASAHKCYGPKGVGVLYVREGTPLAQVLYGGGQEGSLRPGTYNLPAIAGFAQALQVVELSREKEVKRLTQLQSWLIEEMKQHGGNVLGDAQQRTPHIVSVGFEGVDAEMLALQLDQAGYAISTGSACASGAIEESHVVRALGISSSQMGVIRISLGRTTSLRELHRFASTLKSLLVRR